MKKALKLLLCSAGIGAVIYMAQMGEKENRKINEMIDGVNHSNEDENKEKDEETPKKVSEIMSIIKSKIKNVFKDELINTDTDENKTNHKEKAKSAIEIHEDFPDVTEDCQKPVEEELQEGKELFSYLLPLTKKVAENKKSNKALDYGYVIQSWEEALVDDCEILKAKFDSLLQESGEDSSEITVEEAAVVFSKWLDYLKNLGVHEYSDETMDKNGNVTVSVKNRKFYINGRNFKDGSVCAVEKNPWLYNDELYYNGILGDIIENAETEHQFGEKLLDD